MQTVPNSKKRRAAVAAILFLFSAGGIASFPQTPSPVLKPRARVAFEHSLPKLNGDQLKATIVEVHYGPGESSRQHSHPCAVIGYILEGTLRTQVAGEAEAIYRAGESFYEAPNSVHAISANASATEPATFLAYFVCDHESALSVDVPGAKAQEQGGK
jgi:quercetin dioxygenase-like cupin family protein